MSKTLFLLSLLAISFFLPATIARSQDNPVQDNLTELVDQVVDVRLTKNIQYSNFTVIQATEGSEPGSIKSLKLRFPDSKKTRGVSVSKVVEIFIDGQPLDVEYNRRVAIWRTAKRNELHDSRRNRKSTLHFVEVAIDCGLD